MQNAILYTKNDCTINGPPAFTKPAAAEGSIVFLFCLMGFFVFLFFIYILYIWNTIKLDVLFWSIKPEQNDFSRKNAFLAIWETGENQKESVEAQFSVCSLVLG